MSALTQRGLSVQPFKVGPDFIDSAYHSLATGFDSINLDSWMMGTPGLRKSYRRHRSFADVAVVERMGALYDGENGTRDRGSTAFLARRLNLPVILVVDIYGMTRSTTAVLQGFMQFDDRVRIEGVILNRAGSRRHFEMVRNTMPAPLGKNIRLSPTVRCVPDPRTASGSDHKTGERASRASQR